MVVVCNSSSKTLKSSSEFILNKVQVQNKHILQKFMQKQRNTKLIWSFSSLSENSKSGFSTKCFPDYIRNCVTVHDERTPQITRCFTYQVQGATSARSTRGTCSRDVRRVGTGQKYACAARPFSWRGDLKARRPPVTVDHPSQLNVNE